jgi:IS30 family transposase
MPYLTLTVFMASGKMNCPKAKKNDPSGSKIRYTEAAKQTKQRRRRRMSQTNHNTGKGKWKQLSEKERYQIKVMRKAKHTAREIAMILGRDRRTIEREIRRGTAIQRDYEWRERPLYLADVGQRRARESAANKGRGLKIGHGHELCAYIERKIMKERWSPDAVIGRLKAEGWRYQTTICTKTVYNYIGQGIFRNVTTKDLRMKKDGKKREKSKARKVALNNTRGKSITERPQGASDRTEGGHWEIDLVVGKQGTKPVILTLVERKTRKPLYILVRNKTQKEVLAAIRRARKRAGGDFTDVFKSITADNGSEFLNSEAMKQAAGCGEIYYAHPYSSWERGSNENSNRMLRRFIPKGTDIGTITPAQLQRIEDWVNNYPRRIFGFKSSHEMYNAA